MGVNADNNNGEPSKDANQTQYEISSINSNCESVGRIITQIRFCSDTKPLTLSSGRLPRKIFAPFKWSSRGEAN